MIFDWDAGNTQKCQKHGLTRDQIEYVMENAPLVAPDAQHSQNEQRFIAIGKTKDGRPVFVAFCWRDKKLRPISARYMHAREVKRYEQS